MAPRYATFKNILTTYARNGYIEASGLISDPAIRSEDFDFLQDGYISAIPWRLWHIIHIFVQTFQLTLWPWRCLTNYASHFQYTPIFSILQLSVSELCVTQSDRIIFTWNGKCACVVSRDLWSAGAKNDPHFRNPWTKFTYLLCQITKIKPCYRRKIAFFPLWRLQSSLRMWFSTRNNFWPRIVYSSLYNFYGATMTIKGSFILEHPTLKRFSAAKNYPVKIGPQNGGFRKFKGLKFQI